jgi:hypothetical protein
MCRRRRRANLFALTRAGITRIAPREAISDRAGRERKRPAKVRWGRSCGRTRPAGAGALCGAWLANAPEALEEAQAGLLFVFNYSHDRWEPAPEGIVAALCSRALTRTLPEPPLQPSLGSERRSSWVIFCLPAPATCERASVGSSWPNNWRQFGPVLEEPNQFPA